MSTELEGAMTDELKQLAADLQNALGDHLSLGDEYRKILAALAEVQRQTVEAAAKIAHDEGDYFIEKAIRSALSRPGGQE